MKFFGKKKKKETEKYVDNVTFESFSAMYFPNGKLADGYLPEHAEKLTAKLEELRIVRDKKLLEEKEKKKIEQSTETDSAKEQ